MSNSQQLNRAIIATLLMFVFCVSISANNDTKRPNSYNYIRGVEAINNHNHDEALEYLNKELSENPKNGYAFAWIGVVRDYKSEYGRALTAINKALKLLPKKDKEYMSFAHSSRANVYLNLGDTISAIKDYGSAIKFTPDNEDLYEKRAQIYYELKKYDLADADYIKITSINEGSVMGYMGLGRNANDQKDFETAIKYYSHVIKLASDYSSGYSFRAESYIGLGKYNDAIEDIIKALDIDSDNKAYYLLFDVSKSSFQEVEAKLKIQSTKDPNNGFWGYCLGSIYEENNRHKKAIKQYEECLNKDKLPILHYRIARCYESLGDYSSATKHIDFAIEMDSTDYDYVIERADLLYESGKYPEAIAEMTKYITYNPEFYGGYYRRGFYKDNTHDVDGAIEDYSMAIALEPQYAYAFLGRADMYRLKGENDLAKQDYMKVIELDTVPSNVSCAQYAFLELGEKEKSIDYMDRVIANDSINPGNYYDAACLYSRMGNKNKALDMLKIALEKGFRRFNHIENDDDLDGIRQTEEFKNLIKTYQESFKPETQPSEEKSYTEKIVEIPFSKEGDMCKVKCNINNLPLHFIFDTGASDVSISEVEASFMFKNGYLTSKDVMGRQNYVTADGGVHEGTIINLINVEFGGLKLSNIRASVVKNQRAPLLLGQSVLKKLGKIEIDNERQKLIIRYRSTN